jgi:DNA-binding NarL/FixJ family response regulator
MPTVLIIDPQPVVRKGLGWALQKALHGVALVEADGAGAARRAVRVRRIDLIVLEPDLPDADGLRFIKELRAQRPDTPILVFSALAAGEIARRAVGAGASAFQHKDASLQALGQMARELLAGHRRVGPVTEPPTPVPGPRAEPTAPSATLSDRELQVLRLLSQGRSAPEVARVLSISPKTVNTHRRHIYRKLGLDSVSALAAYAFRHGLVPNRRVSSER